ncbi:MAG TPA: M28 family peptidase [Candidatus Thermoplasmatota archaeon]|nr:M28 family peptidase [Candidatus Thermoplasmatota archaeon]
MRALPLFLGLALVLAGCATPSATPDAGTRPEEGPSYEVLPASLSTMPEPAIDIGGIRGWWEQFVRATPYRHVGSPTNEIAADMIAAFLKEAGYEARTLYYLPPNGAESPVAQGIRTVYGVKPGTQNPDHVIGWVAHYDSNQATIYAAYDDASGVAAALELARVLAKVETNKTLMPIFFDAEEVGLVASQYFVQQALARGDVTFDLVIGHDMTGINCPGHEWPMYQMIGENYLDVLKPVMSELYEKFLKLDVGYGEEAKNCIVILDVHDRNSDERRFKEADIPIIRMAGGRRATDYPEYHKPGDTIEYVYEFSGGPENYEKGLHMVIYTSYWSVLAFDALPSYTR